MHAMSIAMSIVDLAEEQARKAHVAKIIEIELDIGIFSGIEIEALNFALEVVAKETLLEAALIKINRIEAESECLNCGSRFASKGFIHQCPSCRETNTRILKGKEMQVKSLLVE